MKEKQRYIAEALLLDIDGVVTDPSEKRITNQALLDIFVTRLQREEIVSFNSGRALSWIEKEVLGPLQQKLQENGLPRALLRYVIAVAEKGGARITYSESGEKQIFIDPNIRIPDGLHEQIQSLLKGGYTDAETGLHTDFSTMFADDEKQTMATIEMKNGENHDDQSPFKKQQTVLKDALKHILASNLWDREFTVDATTVATDIENKSVGKAYGVHQILEMLGQRNISVGEFFAFGDSISDIEMAEELTKQGQKVTFVYVGQGNPWQNKHLPFPIDTEYAGAFHEGTVAYLARH